MAKDFFRKRPPSLRQLKMMPVSKEAKVSKFVNGIFKITTPKIIAPKGLAFQNKFNQMMREQEEKDSRIVDERV